SDAASQKSDPSNKEGQDNPTEGSKSTSLSGQQGSQSGEQVGAESPPSSSTPEGMSEEQAANLRRMVESMAGRKLQFLDNLPPDLQSLDDLIDRLQHSIAQMQSLMDSMSRDMRQQLQQLMEDLLRDDRLKWDMAQLAANLDRLQPSRQFRNRYPFHGDESLSF